jgi:hypothetical protein
MAATNQISQPSVSIFWPHFNIYTKGGGILSMIPPDFTEDASDPNADCNMGMGTTDLK